MSNATVQAQWSALNSGYAVTTDTHGSDTPINVPVTATAGTTDATIEEVEFLWKDSDETVVWDVTVAVSSNGTMWDGKLIYYAQDTQSPDSIGDWAVQALFRGPGGHLKGQESGIVKIRATSLHSVPEVPIGTLAIMLSLFAGLGIFVLAKRKTTLPKIH